MIAVIISALPITIDKHVMLLQGSVVCACEIAILKLTFYMFKILILIINLANFSTRKQTCR